MSSEITEAQKQQYGDEGYMILERVIPDAHLKLLRAECSGPLDRMHKRMDEAGSDVIGINHRNKRYFVANCFKERPVLGTALWGYAVPFLRDGELVVGEGAPDLPHRSELVEEN